MSYDGAHKLARELRRYVEAERDTAAAVATAVDGGGYRREYVAKCQASLETLRRAAFMARMAETLLRDLVRATDEEKARWRPGA
jgi:hypothetical protein